jgi:exopolyphosphatase/guanosine-5'-triphosphate,3'-diphosphate pyrophosphatase
MTGHSSKLFTPSAVIDVGTNTLRLLVGYVEKGRLVRLTTERAITRLGRNLGETGVLDKVSISKSIKSLVLFKALIEKYRVQKVIAIGTSALRDAANSGEFLDAVKDQTGISIDIISGDEEAELTVLGVLGYGDVLSRPVFIVDIGGGSTEWVFADGRSTRSSIKIGAVRLQEEFVHSDPPSPNEIGNLRNSVVQLVAESLLSHNISSGNDVGNVGNFIATGGTATTVAAMDKGLDSYVPEAIHLHKISFNSLKAQLDHLAATPLSYRAKINGLEPERADIIIPGMIILSVFMEILKISTLTISDYGLMEGILLKEIMRHGLLI